MVKIALIGGHITTAQAVVEELLATGFKKSDLVFLGRKKEFGRDSAEYEIVKNLELNFYNVSAVKINRFFSLKNIFGFVFFPLTIFSNIILLLKVNPQVIVGFGGYLSLPVCLAGKILMKKIYIHEGTTMAGASNRIISHFADRVMISFKSSERYFKNPVLTGLPLRAAILNVEKVKTNIPVFLISGGHSGSQKVNECVSKIINDLLLDFIVIHQTGKLDFEKISEERLKINPEKRIRYVIKPFFNELEYASHLANADIFAGRSGVNTVCETIYLKVKSIFIPLPFSQQNEQYENARIAENLGLAEIINQKDLTSHSFLSAIKKLKRVDASQINTDLYRDILKNAARSISKILNEKAE